MFASITTDQLFEVAQGLQEVAQGLQEVCSL